MILIKNKTKIGMVIRVLVPLGALFQNLSFAEDLESCESKFLEANEPQNVAFCYAQEADRLQIDIKALFKQKLADIDSSPYAQYASPQLRASARRHFIDAQAHWQAYEEAACSFESDTTLGSGAGFVYHACRISESKRRITELEKSGF